MELTRRDMLALSTRAATTVALPSIVPASVFGANAPSQRITLGLIGMGRQTRYANLPQFLQDPSTQVLGVCDVDTWRLNQAKQQVDKHYENSACVAYSNWQELIARKDIDAIMNATPDHWHVPISLAAVRAGKHVSCEKPLTLSVAEGRVLADAVARMGVVFRTDSECRSAGYLRHACELALNGYLGNLKRIEVSVPPGDIAGGKSDPMPGPPELDYAMWLGPAPQRPYTVDLVHPRRSYGRPGWMRYRDYCEGMVTNWGTHLIDVAQWGHDSDRSGPVEVEGQGTYPDKGTWNVLLDFHIHYKYADGVRLDYLIARPQKIYLRFEGDEGWVESHWLQDATMRASRKSLTKLKLKPNDIHLPRRGDKEDFIHAIKHKVSSMQDAEVGHRTCSMCQIGHIAIQCGRKLQWDPDGERFVGSDQANDLLYRSYRAPWGLDIGVT